MLIWSHNSTNAGLSFAVPSGTNFSAIWIKSSTSMLRPLMSWTSVCLGQNTHVVKTYLRDIEIVVIHSEPSAGDSDALVINCFFVDYLGFIGDLVVFSEVYIIEYLIDRFPGEIVYVRWSPFLYRMHKSGIRDSLSFVSLYTQTRDNLTWSMMNVSSYPNSLTNCMKIYERMHGNVWYMTYLCITWILWVSLRQMWYF